MTQVEESLPKAEEPDPKPVDQAEAERQYQCTCFASDVEDSESEDECIVCPREKSLATSAPVIASTNAAKDESGDDKDHEESSESKKKRPLSPVSREEEPEGARRRFQFGSHGHDEPPEPIPDLFAKLEQYVANDYRDHCECIAELKRAITEAKLPYDEAWQQRNVPQYPLLKLSWVIPISASIRVNLGLGNTSPAWVTTSTTEVKYDSITAGVEALKRAFAPLT